MQNLTSEKTRCIEGQIEGVKDDKIHLHLTLCVGQLLSTPFSLQSTRVGGFYQPHQGPGNMDFTRAIQIDIPSPTL